jgi:hypothetical protein
MGLLPTYCNFAIRDDGMKIRLQLSQPTKEEYLMIGISSSLADYHLSHLLNKQFQLGFMRRPDIPFYSKTGLIGHFPFYSFQDEDLRMDYYIIGNKNLGRIAIKDYKHFEFFILIQLSSYSIAINDILVEMRKLRGLNAALTIPTQQLKSFNEILEDIELHLMEINSKTQKDAMTWLWVKKKSVQ